MSQITLCYGPIEVGGVVSFRPLRLKKLISLLSTLGFNVTTERIQPRDRLVVKLNGVSVFTCRFTYLKFYYKEGEDYIVHRLIWVVLEARERLLWGRKAEQRFLEV